MNPPDRLPIRRALVSVFDKSGLDPVSYTHLTLPTIYSV